MNNPVNQLEEKLHKVLRNRFQEDISNDDWDEISPDEESSRILTGWLQIEQGIFQEKSSEPWEIYNMLFEKEIEFEGRTFKIPFDLICRQYYINYSDEELTKIYTGNYKIVTIQYDEKRTECKKNLEGLISLQALILRDILEIELANLTLEVLFFTNNLHLERIRPEKLTSDIEKMANEFLNTLI